MKVLEGEIQAKRQLIIYHLDVFEIGAVSKFPMLVSQEGVAHVKNGVEEPQLISSILLVVAQLIELVLVDLRGQVLLQLLLHSLPYILAHQTHLQQGLQIQVLQDIE